MTWVQELRRQIYAMVISVFIFGPIVYMLTDREPPYERGYGVIRPPMPLPGSDIEAEWQVRTNRTCTPANNRNVTRQIVDSHKVVWDFESTPSTYGREVTANDNPDRIIRVFKLPQGIAPGPATYRNSACFACNPLQRIWPICIDRPSIEFVVAVPPVVAGPQGERGLQGPQGEPGPH